MNTVYVLAFATLVIVVAVGVWQLISVNRSKAKRGEPSGFPVVQPTDNVTSPARAPVGPKPEDVTPTRQ